MYSIEEVLSFTVKDIQDRNFVNVKVRGWLQLTTQQREECIMKLRGLVRQRDEMAQSIAVDANELENRLDRVERSRSRTPIAPPFDPDDPEQVEGDLRIEEQAHEALVSDNGRPCYSIELGFDVFKHPGQYREILEYWEGESGAGEDTKRWVFFRQLKRWQKFRQFQQQNRRYLLFHGTFPEFHRNVIERRRRHELDDDMHLLEEQIKQSKLEDWVEYQDYELRTYERLQNDFEEAQARLAFRRQALAEAGISAFEEIQELEFASYYSLAIECGREEAKAESKKKSAERSLRLAERRLKVAKSEYLGETVERATWVTLFHKEVEGAQIRFDKLQRLANNAKHDFEPFHKWLESRHNEWDRESEEGQRLIRLEVESAEFQDRNKKYDAMQKQEYEAGFACFLAGKEIEFTEEGHNAAQLDDFGATVERVALINIIQREAQLAQTQYEEAREAAEKIKLKRKVISALSSIPLTREKIKRHNILLVWIEQQRREIARGRANTEQERNQGQSNRASSLVDPAEVSKAPSKRRIPRQKMSVLRGASQAAEKSTIYSSSPELRSRQVLKVRDAMPASLRLVRSSRVSKPGGKRPIKLRRDGARLPSATGTRRQKREHNFGLPSTQSTGRKAMQQSSKASLRRSTRTSKPPDRFRPGHK